MNSPSSSPVKSHSPVWVPHTSVSSDNFSEAVVLATLHRQTEEYVRIIDEMGARVSDELHATVHELRREIMEIQAQNLSGNPSATLISPTQEYHSARVRPTTSSTDNGKMTEAESPTPRGRFTAGPKEIRDPLDPKSRCDNTISSVMARLASIKEVSTESTYQEIEQFVKDFITVVSRSGLSRTEKFWAFENKGSLCQSFSVYWKDWNGPEGEFEQMVGEFLKSTQQGAPKRNPHNMSLIRLQQVGSLDTYFHEFGKHLHLADDEYRSAKVALDMFEAGLCERLRNKTAHKNYDDYWGMYYDLKHSEVREKNRTTTRRPHKGFYQSTQSGKSRSKSSD